MPSGPPRPTPAQWLLGVATVLAYAVGYPVALVGGSPFGWVLVTLGGFLLLAFGVVTVRRIHGSGPSS